LDPSVAPPKLRRSLLDLGPRARLAFAVVYVCAMTAVVATAPFRLDRVFGFQMFNQASKIEIRLARKVRGVRDLVPVVDGEWQARDRRGKLRTFRWEDRVRDSVLHVLDRPVHARYGVEGQLFRLKYALADVLDHIPRDAETTGFVASVSAWKNGRAAKVVRVKADRRASEPARRNRP
jgi:hypothetical protein